MNIEEFITQYDHLDVMAHCGWIKVYDRASGSVRADIQYDPVTTPKVLESLGVKPTDPFVRLLKKHGFNAVTQKRLRPGGVHTDDARLHVYKVGTDTYSLRAVLHDDDILVAARLTLAKLDRVLTELYS